MLEISEKLQAQMLQNTIKNRNIFCSIKGTKIELSFLLTIERNMWRVLVFFFLCKLASSVLPQSIITLIHSSDGTLIGKNIFLNAC